MARMVAAQGLQIGAHRHVGAVVARACLRAAASCLLMLGVHSAGAAETWSCYANKPGHPTPEQRALFVQQVSELAIAAEKKYGVPASALAALAIAESGYGWTRLALEANNLFGWKFGRSARDDRRAFYTLPCQKRPKRWHRYVRFASHADAVDYVAAKLATVKPYRRHTQVYRAARAAGQPVETATDAWLFGIAETYSSKPEHFVSKIRRIIQNPLEPADPPSPIHSLHRLSAMAQTR